MQLRGATFAARDQGREPQPVPFPAISALAEIVIPPSRGWETVITHALSIQQTQLQ